MAGKFPEYVYNPLFLADKYEENIGLIDKAAIRKDYSQMRKLANQRLSRFKGTEWEKSATYRFNKNRFKRLDQIKSVDELAALVVEVKEFLENPVGSVSGQARRRAKTILELHERGFTFVNKANFSEFTAFMNRMRALGLSNIYDSEQTAEIWSKTREKGATAEEVAEAYKQYSEDNAKAGGRTDGPTAAEVERIWKSAERNRKSQAI